MVIGVIYSIVILFACILGAIVGLGGGVFIRPIFDAIGYHGVLDINFFASAAILSMAVVSTVKKIKDGVKIDVKKALLISSGAVVGGLIGNLVLEHLINVFEYESQVQMAQIIATVIVLTLSLILTAKNHLRYEIRQLWVCALLGVFLGSVAVFLGIGGGPINVPILMIFFSMDIKLASAFSIVIIFFSHLSRMVTMGITVGYAQFDLPLLPVIVISAAVGGLIGARLSKVFSDNTVKRLFQAAISAVIVLNVVNGVLLL